MRLVVVPSVDTKPSSNRSSPNVKNRARTRTRTSSDYDDISSTKSTKSSSSSPISSPMSSFLINSTMNSPLTSFLISQYTTINNNNTTTTTTTTNTTSNPPNNNVNNAISSNTYIDPDLLPLKTKKMIKKLHSNLPDRYLDTSQTLSVIQILSEQNYWSDEDEDDNLLALNNTTTCSKFSSLSTPKSSSKKSKVEMIKPKSLTDTATSLNTQLCHKMREETRKKKIENAVLIMLRKKMEKVGLQKRAKAEEMLAMLKLSFTVASKISRIRVRDIIKTAIKNVIQIEQDKREHEMHLHNRLIHYKNKLVGSWRKYRGRSFAGAVFLYFKEYKQKEDEKILQEEREYRIRAARRRLDEDKKTKESILKVYEYNQANKNVDDFNSNSYYYNTEETKFFKRQAKTKYPLPRSVAVLRHDEGIETIEGYIRQQNQIAAWEHNKQKTSTWEDFANVDKKAIFKSQQGESCAMRLVRQWMDKHDKKTITMENINRLDSKDNNDADGIDINDTTIVLVQQPVVILPTIIDEINIYND